MRKYFKTFFAFALLTIVLGTSSCFDILEEYTFNADGSGKATMVVDVAKMVDMMSAFGSAMDSTGTGDSKSMDEMFDENATFETLKKLPGISNVVNLNSKEEKKIGYSFDFENIDALNTALIARGSDMGLGGALGMAADESSETEKENSFSFSGKKFSRKFDMKMEPKEGEDDDEKQYAEMAMMMFKDAKYTIKYIFPRTVKKVKGNDAALIGADKKTVTLENNLADLLEGKTNMNTEIRLK